MFTGLIQALGVVEQIHATPTGNSLVIDCPELMAGIRAGDSIAVNGVCLTAAAIDQSAFTAQVVHTTLEKTTTGFLNPGDRVNLELALRASDRLGGHIVQGHVNAISRIAAIDALGENWRMRVAFPSHLRKYLVLEGPVALDGISLTVAGLDCEQLMVSIIPHTLRHTTLKDKAAGSLLNLEVDLMAKYVENFLCFKRETGLPA